MPRLTVLLAVLYAPSLIAQNIHPVTPPEARAVPLQGSFRLDGKLDDPVWQVAPAATGLRQSQPHSGEPATQRTEVRFAFKDTTTDSATFRFDVTDGKDSDAVLSRLADQEKP